MKPRLAISLVFLHIAGVQAVRAYACIHFMFGFFFWLNFNAFFSSSIVVYSPFSGYFSFKRDTVEREKKHTYKTTIELIQPVGTHFTNCVYIGVCVCVCCLRMKRNHIHNNIVFKIRLNVTMEA